MPFHKKNTGFNDVFLSRNHGITVGSCTKHVQNPDLCPGFEEHTRTHNLESAHLQKHTTETKSTVLLLLPGFLKLQAAGMTVSSQINQRG